MKLKKLSESEFYNSEYPILFSNDLTSEFFGLISCKSNGYKFAWQSKLVEPVVTELDAGRYAIGIDQDYAIVDLKANSVLLQLTLFYFFYDTKINGNIIYVITQLEVVKIDRYTFDVIEMCGLPEYFEKIEFENGYARIYCMGGASVVL